MKILGLIPARGGSKSIPNKNITPLAGRPLLAYTAEAVAGSRLLSRTILSTDDPDIARVGRSLDLEVPFLRPQEFSQDESTAVGVVRHALEFLADHEKYFPDAVMLLQPTSPLRRPEHIDAAIEIMQQTSADSVVSVVPIPHHFNPVSVMKLESGRLSPWYEGAHISRRQEKPSVLARNGPVVLLTRTKAILEQDSLYGNDCRPLLMEAHESVDIDGPADLEYAEFLLSRSKMAA